MATLIIGSICILVLLWLRPVFAMYAKKIWGYCRIPFLYPSLKRHPKIKSLNLSLTTDPKTYSYEFSAWPKADDGSYEKIILLTCSIASGEPIVGIADPEYARQLVLQENVPKNMTAYSGFQLLFGRGLVSLQTNAEWKMRRRVLTPTFHFKSLSSMIPRVSTNVATCLLNVLDKVSNGEDRKKLRPKSISHPISMRLVTSLIFGGDFDDTFIVEQMTIVLSHFRDYLLHRKLLGRIAEYVPWETGHHIFSRSKNAIINRIKQNLNEKRQVLKSGKKGDDLISLMLQAQQLNPDIITDQVIVEESMLFFLAGFDTTSSALAWALYAMSQFEDIQQKLRDEVNTLLPNGESITTKKQLNSFKYTKAFIKETLRLFSPVSGMHRRLARDITLGDTTLKAGQPIRIGYNLLLRSPKTWSRPLEFDPTRFLGDNDRALFSWIPFSAGPRNCIGQQLAMMELVIMITSIVKQFRIVLPKGQNTENVTSMDNFYGHFLNEPKPSIMVELETL
mmetsp:Transcript_18618/g.20707  ORF Transcript_18618/g.20707 Transcript_18618/m.20707 type:complete len:506 (+) Transcript_18618:48-1565(+)